MGKNWKTLRISWWLQLSKRQSLTFLPIHSLLIVRNRNIVLDAYFYPFQADQLHDGASMTKSVTSTLIGIAIGQHKLSGVSQSVLSLFPQRAIANRDQRKEQVTIEQLLTMTSNLD